MLWKTEFKEDQSGDPNFWASVSSSVNGDAHMLSHFSYVWLFATLWTVIHQAPLPMGFSRQEYWSGLPCPPPGDLPDPGIKLAPLTSPALASGFFITSITWEAQNRDSNIYIMMLLEVLEKVPRKWLVYSPLPHKQSFSLAVISWSDCKFRVSDVYLFPPSSLIILSNWCFTDLITLNNLYYTILTK